MKKIALILLAFNFASSANAFSKVSLYNYMTIPNGTIFQNTVIGGLSGLFFDPHTQTLSVISDDPGKNSDNRFYEFSVDYRKSVPLEIQNVHIFRPENNLKKDVFLDSEGIVRTSEGHLIVSSETLFDGSKNFHKIFDQNGEQIGAFSVGDKFIPKADFGIQANKGFEGLTTNSDSSILWTANESPLHQDKIEGKDLVRLIKLVKKENYEVLAEYAYELEPFPVAKNGLSEMMYISEHKLLTIERAHNYLTNTTIVRLFEVEIKNSKNYKNVPAFKSQKKIQTVTKKLLLDFKDLKLPKVDNLEGISFGPTLPNGKNSLIVVSDNNFNPLQITQFIFLQLED